MAKDIRDLYKKRGEKLSNDVNESKKNVELRLKENIKNIRSINTEMRSKLLQLRHTYKISPNNAPILDNTRSMKKDKILTLIISFGINYQRVEGNTITNISEFLNEFKTTYKLEVEIEDLFKNLDILNESGLIYRYTLEELLFEPITQSKDLNQILILVSHTGYLEHEVIKSMYPEWSDEKINDLINLLESEGILLKDGTKYWFPQLEK